MYVEQHLSTCEACSSVLALQYHWAAGRAPGSLDRVVNRAFRCPVCRHLNPFLTLLHAHGFVLKRVEGPEADGRVHPNTLRRLWHAFPRHSERGDSS